MLKISARNFLAFLPFLAALLICLLFQEQVEMKLAIKWFFLIGSFLSGIIAVSMSSLTERKQSKLKIKDDVEFQLKQSRDNLNFALKSGGMGTWTIDLKTRGVSCSQEMLDLWGVKAENFNGQRPSLQSKVHPDDLERMNTLIDIAIHNDSIYEMEYRIFPTPGNLRWVMSRGRCTFDAHSNEPVYFSGVVYDITESKMKEEALAAAVRTRDQFFMIASHELKTPLTCLELQIQISKWELKHKYPEAFTASKLESGLNKQREHLLRITRIVDNILDESKISEGRLLLRNEPFCLNEMVTDVLDRFKVNAEAHGIEVRFNSVESIQGMWDRFRLEQVLNNLLINAIRYGNNKPIHVEVTKEGSNAMMIVRDEGMGIKAEDQSRVFERFERAISENEVSGIGLGLYISKNIVRAHGGEIRLKSEFGKGSEFAVIIPVTSQPQL